MGQRTHSWWEFRSDPATVSVEVEQTRVRVMAKICITPVINHSVDYKSVFLLIILVCCVIVDVIYANC